MEASIYSMAKKNLKKTNSIINDVFIKQQEKDLGIKQDDLYLKKLNQIEKKVDTLIEQNIVLKKINIILLDNIKNNHEDIKDILLDNGLFSDSDDRYDVEL